MSGQPVCRRRYRLAIVDLDGVVWRAGEPIRENIEGIGRLRSEGTRVVFMTNNATRGRRLYSMLLSRVVGWSVSVDDIVTSAFALAQWAKGRGSLRVYVVGGPGLVEELVLAGHVPVTEAEVEDCGVDAVAVGLDTELTYSKLHYAARALRDCGALYLVANTDRTIPVRRGLAPGAGSIVEALSTATGRSPDIVAGKPSPLMAAIVFERLSASPREALVVGDRLDTDVEMAHRIGADSLLVETGVPPPPNPQPRPTYRAATVLDYTELPLCDE